MTYKETLDYLYYQLPMFQRIGPAAFKKDLGNILALCQQIGMPQDQFPSIHLAGTNGKGSTAHLLSSVLQAAGLKVGLYTSPHYRDFRERIKISGKYIPQKKVVAFVADNKPSFERIKPSFFEITVAMAFDYFAKEKVDIAIIETGLGGRLDSTNIIQPLVSVITNISFDHQQFLGDTLPAIAGEKAGIIKNNTPVVIGERQDEVAQVFCRKADELNAPIRFASDEIQVKKLDVDPSHTTYKIDYLQTKDISDTSQNIVNISPAGGGEGGGRTRKNLSLQAIKVNLRGPFQAKNIATALTTLTVLKQNSPFFKTKSLETCIQNGFKDLQTLTAYKGRWQIIGQNPLTICDSAHNEGGLRILFDEIKRMEYGHLHFVYGTVADKELEKVFPLFPLEATYYFAKANIPRGMDAKKLKKTANSKGLKGRAYTSVRNALKAAKRKAAPNDLIFVGGSIFVVAEVIQ